MKKLFLLSLTVAFAVLLAVPASAAVEVVDPGYYARFRGKGKSINVHNWGEYIADGSDGGMDVIAEFEKLTGIKVNYTTFSTNEEVYARLRGGSANYDVIIRAII